MLKIRKNLIYLLAFFFFLALGMACNGLNTRTATAAVSRREDEPNNVSVTANSVPLNTEIVGNLSGENDQDWFKFTTEKNGYFDIAFNHTFLSSSNSYWDIYLYDESAERGIDGKSNYYEVPGNANLTTSRYGISAGVYYVRITADRNYSANEYHFIINFTEADDWETENNNSGAAADELAVNAPTHGALSSGTDVDCFCFTTSADGYINIMLNHAALANANSYWRIYLYDNTGENTVGGESFYYGVPGNVDRTTNNVGISAGTYFVKIIADFYYSSEVYELAVNFTEADDWETENNHSKRQSADEIPVNKQINGSISHRSDEDWYCFSTSVNGYFSVTFNHVLLNSFNPYWNIYLHSEFYENPDMNGIDGSSVYFSVSGNKNSKTYYYGIPAGKYYIRITSAYYHSECDYNLTVNFTETDDWETENNNIDRGGEADEIALNTTMHGAFTSGDDRDCFKFTITEESEITLIFAPVPFDLVNKGDGWTLRLYRLTDVGNDLLFRRIAGETGRYSLACGTLPAGEYLIQLIPERGSLADYTLNVFGGHEHEGEWAISVAPTCTQNGTERRTCTICGVVEEREVASIGHDYEGVVLKPASVVAKGETEFTCKRCGHKYIATDSQFLWVLPVVCPGSVLVVLGVINYIRILKKKH